jgi:O-antigen/teichoic acid export membrane protein
MVIQLVSGLLLTPVLIERLGEEPYALWALAAMVLGWFGVMEAGIGGAVQRFLAGAYATGDTRKINEQFNTGLAICLALAALIALAVVAASSPISSQLTDTTGQAGDLRVVLLWLLVALVLTMQTGIFATVLTARERFVPVGLVGLVSDIVRLGVSLAIVIRWNGTIIDLAIANAAIEAAVLVSMAVVGQVLVGLPPIRPRYLDLSKTGVVLAGFAGWSLFITISYILRTRLDLAVAKVFVGFETVAVFAVGSTLAGRVQGVVSQFGGPYTSRLSRLHAVGNREGVVEQYLHGSSVQESMAMIGGVGMLVFAPAFMQLWMGDKLAPEQVHDATRVMQILALGWFLGLNGGLIGPLLRAENRMRTLSMVVFTEGVLNLALSILFVVAFGWGLNGIAAGTAVAAVLIRGCVAPYIASRTMQVPQLRYRMELQVPVLLIGGAGAALGLLIRPEQYATSWWLFFPMAAIYGAALFAVTCIIPHHPIRVWTRARRGAMAEDG